MCFTDLEQFDFCRTETRTARKPHRCSERGCVIAKGEEYQYLRAKCDGEMMSVKTCASCQRIQAEIERREVAAGCSWNEAHPGHGEGRLREVLFNYDDEERAEIIAAAQEPKP